MKSLVKILLLSVLIFLVSFVFSQKISNIECYSQYGPCGEETQNHFSSLIGRRLYSKISDQEISKFTEKPQLIKSIKVYRRFPQTLIVHLDYRQPIVRVASSDNASQSAVDSDGVVLSANTFSALPYLQTSAKYSIGDTLDQNTLKAVRVLKTITTKFGTPTQSIYSESVLAIQISETKILLDMDYLSEKWPDTLQKVLGGSKINAKVPKTVDLRFSQPVLTY